MRFCRSPVLVSCGSTTIDLEPDYTVTAEKKLAETGHCLKTAQYWNHTLVSTPNYPRSDELLQRTIASCIEEQGNCSIDVSINRAWQTQADTLKVSYHFERGRPVRAEVGEVLLDLNRPLKLQPVEIPKPWGREIWYTGMEARGESRVANHTGSLELLSYLSLAPDHLCAAQQVLLLKVLESRPQPLLGELYFEIHRDKQEVYVVTDIDTDAYPDAVGSVRFGMNQTLRKQYSNDAEFRTAFAAAVNDYEQSRRTADQTPDKLDNTTLSAEEDRARTRVLEFTNLKPLRAGDVLAVPAGVPHALQHGIRVIEFQTPSYERQIIYSAQKVLTQDRWDSAEAIATMQLDPPAATQTDPATGRIAAFPEFSVWRALLDAASPFYLPADLPYALCVALQGSVQIVDALGELTLAPGEAAFIPRSASSVCLQADTAATVLIAAPGL